MSKYAKIETDDQLASVMEELDRCHWGGALVPAGWRAGFQVLSNNKYGIADLEKRVILINLGLIENQGELRRTLLHELIHAGLHFQRDPSHQRRNASHGSAFLSEVERLHNAGEDVASERAYADCASIDPARLTEAAEVVLRRQLRILRPAGKYDNAGRWTPSDDEWQECCASVRQPSRAYPFSYLSHCRTISHISRLHGVDTVALRGKVKELKKCQEAARLP